MNPTRRPLAMLGAGLLLGLAAGLGYFLGIPRAEPPRSSSAPAPGIVTMPVVGAPAPDFSLASPDGTLHTLSDARGSVVVVNFWATWCEPCRTEMPMLQAAYDRHAADGLLVLGVDFDEPADEVEAYGNELGLTFPLLLDPGADIQQLYRIRGYPSTFILDRAGRLVVEHIGVLTEERLASYLELAGISS